MSNAIFKSLPVGKWRLFLNVFMDSCMHGMEAWKEKGTA